MTAISLPCCRSDNRIAAAAEELLHHDHQIDRTPRSRLGTGRSSDIVTPAIVQVSAIEADLRGRCRTSPEARKLILRLVQNGPPATDISDMIKDVIMRRMNEAALLPTEGRPGTATARLISGARGAIWPFAGPSASTVVSA